MAHDGRDDGDDHHDGDQHKECPFKMRVPSPLSADVERVMTRVIDCAMVVHRTLGPGFLESIYQRAMSIELTKAGVAFEPQKRIDVVYDGIVIPGQRVDLVVAEVVVVELKCTAQYHQVHRAQVISYLRTMNLRAGLLINFQVPLLYRGITRIVL
jgi:GxxExxY protein